MPSTAGRIEAILREAASSCTAWVRSFLWHQLYGPTLVETVRGVYPDLLRLRPVQMASWHRGSRYYRATLSDGTHQFVKTDGIHRQLAREIEGVRRMKDSDLGCRFTTSVKWTALDARIPIAGFDWLAGKTLAQLITRGSSELSELVTQLPILLDALHGSDIVHRDVTPQNLLVVGGVGFAKGAQLILVDYAFAVLDGDASMDARLPTSELAVLGHGYTEGPFLWDDAVACRVLLREIQCAAGREFLDVVAAIEDRVGRRVCRLQPEPA